MAQYYSEITEEQAKLIKSSPLFFVGTSAKNSEGILDGLGPINISPKGSTTLHITNSNRVAYLESGNEAARRLLSSSPITVMICSFEAAVMAFLSWISKETVASQTVDGFTKNNISTKACSTPMMFVMDL